MIENNKIKSTQEEINDLRLQVGKIKNIRVLEQVIANLEEHKFTLTDQNNIEICNEKIREYQAKIDAINIVHKLIYNAFKKL